MTSTDASLFGWGGVLNDVTCEGHWSLVEQTFHINFLELLTVLYVLQSFQVHLKNKHVRVLIDNTTAVSCITHMVLAILIYAIGLLKQFGNGVLFNKFGYQLHTCLVFENIGADKESCKIYDETEWMLNHRVFNRVLEILHLIPDIDLFASRLNQQVERYVSHKPDPQAIAVDAFLINWNDFDVFYAFPPFSLITQVLQKIQSHGVTGLLVVLDWPTQVNANADQLSVVDTTKKAFALSACNYILKSWRTSTQKQYSTYLRQW